MTRVSVPRSLLLTGALLATAWWAGCTGEDPVSVDDVALFAPGGGGPKVKVDATDPPSAEQDTTLDVRVLGSGYDQGSEATFLLDRLPSAVTTNSTTFVNGKELVANITIPLTAVADLYDVEVLTRRGRKGIGIERFEVLVKGGPKQEPYEFEYDFTDDRDGGSSSFALGSDCVLKLPGSGSIGYGRTYWCDVSDPIFRLKVVDTSTNQPVTGGTVVWKRCERIADDEPVGWTKCGVLQRGKRVYRAVVFGQDIEPVGGVYELELSGWVDGADVWGMSWGYWDDDKPKPDIETKFKDLACVWYRNAYDGPVWKSCDPPPAP